MPWHEDGRAKGPVGQLVSMLFGLLSALTHLAFLPVRAAGKLAGGVAAALVKVIGTTLGVATRLVGLLLLVAIVALVLVTAFSLVSLV
jgi:hypothetical protein